MALSSRADRPPAPFLRLIAGGCAALVLLLVVLEACPPLHAWLHGEKELDADDNCSVVLFANGVTPAGETVALVAIVLFVWRAVFPPPTAIVLAQPRFRLPYGQAPPAGL
jgi:hypothetical protein